MTIQMKSSVDWQCIMKLLNIVQTEPYQFQLCRLAAGVRRSENGSTRSVGAVGRHLFFTRAQKQTLLEPSHQTLFIYSLCTLIFLYLFPTINIWNIHPLQIFSGGFDWHFKLLSQCNSIKALRRNPVPFVCMSNDCSVFRCSAGTCLPAWIKLINSQRATLACMISHGGYRSWDMTQCRVYFLCPNHTIHFPLSLLLLLLLLNINTKEIKVFSLVLVPLWSVSRLSLLVQTKLPPAQILL